MKQDEFDILLKFLEIDCHNNPMLLLSKVVSDNIPAQIRKHIKRDGSSIESVADVHIGSHIDMIALIKSIQQKHKLKLWKELDGVLK